VILPLGYDAGRNIPVNRSRRHATCKDTIPQEPEDEAARRPSKAARKGQDAPQRVVRAGFSDWFVRSDGFSSAE
jgi:hypothetical protein